MPKFNFKDPVFIKTALKEEHYPTLRDEHGNEMVEIAVAGRSNVGKSSLLNHLFQRKGLVKTSATPGKTQALNFFTVDDSLALVDLPGYGFAKVPHHVRKTWGPMVQQYLDGRPTLKLVLLLFDIRRVPNADDFQMMDWLIHSGHAVIVVLTKVDKVKANERKANTQKILKAFNIDNLYYTYYSSTKNVGRKELISMVNDALSDAKL
ncbi:MAG: ribosome biogenesis GTP-binding protein YihA/YsxC [Chlamydiota bacterium]|nr:ribosome biogenesis GTP-binding protein YihA/YsxC [Chlamydiota bacterium]